MNLKVIVFDFDGTLIYSQKMKIAAFYKLFPRGGREEVVVAKVLDEIPEQSRYQILSRILEQLEQNNNIYLKDMVDSYAERYNQIVLGAAKRCPEMVKASSLLSHAANIYKLYVISTTPLEPLKEIIAYRGWQDYFTGVYGYPCSKDKALMDIIKNESITPDDLLMVGDGLSDQQATEKVGSHFFKIEEEDSLLILSQLIALRLDDL